MAGKSIQERIAATETRIQQLEAQRRLLAQQVKQQERKERTRRLIQIGGIMVRLGADNIEMARRHQAVAESHDKVRKRHPRVT